MSEFADQKDKLFCEIACDLNFITAEQVTKALEQQIVDRAIGVNNPIGEYLLSEKFLAVEQLEKILKIQGKLENTSCSLSPTAPGNSELEGANDLSKKTVGKEHSSENIWIYINPLIFGYNCYAATFNYFYAANNVWAQTLLCVFINLLILVHYPTMLRKSSSQISNKILYTGVFLFVFFGCLIGFYSGNPNKSRIATYYNSFLSPSFNKLLTIRNNIDKIKQEGDDSSFLQFLKYQLIPQTSDLILEAEKLAPPDICKDVHENYSKNLNKFKTVAGDLIKSIEDQNVESFQASFEELIKVISSIDNNLMSVQKIGKENGLFFNTSATNIQSEKEKNNANQNKKTLPKTPEIKKSELEQIQKSLVKPQLNESDYAVIDSKSLSENEKQIIHALVKALTIAGKACSPAFSFQGKSTEEGREVYTIQGGSIVDDHFATHAWYKIDTKTGELFEEDVVECKLVPTGVKLDLLIREKEKQVENSNSNLEGDSEPETFTLEFIKDNSPVYESIGKNVLFRIPKGIQCSLLEVGKDSLKVQFEDGQIGWVNKTDLKISGSDTSCSETFPDSSDDNVTSVQEESVQRLPVQNGVSEANEYQSFTPEELAIDLKSIVGQKVQVDIIHSIFVPDYITLSTNLFDVDINNIPRDQKIYAIKNSKNKIRVFGEIGKLERLPFDPIGVIAHRIQW